MSHKGYRLSPNEAAAHRRLLEQLEDDQFISPIGTMPVEHTDFPEEEKPEEVLS